MDIKQTAEIFFVSFSYSKNIRMSTLITVIITY